MFNVKYTMGFHLYHSIPLLLVVLSIPISSCHRIPFTFISIPDPRKQQNTSYTIPTPTATASKSQQKVRHQQWLPTKSETLRLFGKIESCSFPSSTNGILSTHPTKNHQNANIVASVALMFVLTMNSALYFVPLEANAVTSKDNANETVLKVLQDLTNNSGNSEGTVRVFEDIAAIITEGRGVGGEINFQGIQLERGFVADEDTTIYNPGLTLLTETEKTKIVEGVVESRKVGLATNQWNIDTQAGYEFIRERLDPLHTYELQGYLKIVPFYAAFLYAGVLIVQQTARELFAPAYIVAAAAFFLPAIVLISLGS